MNRAQVEEPRYPLHAYVCSNCRLVQLEQSETPQTLFGDYAYFSGYSQSWLRHCDQYAARMTADLELGAGSLVVELASNDGCLLQCFQRRGVTVQGVDPAANVAEVARENGVPTEVDFFGLQVARRMVAHGLSADLITANNVLAHVPNINDFIAGMKHLLKSDGLITVEFPHLLRLIESNQFDTIYHEHIFYLSLEVVREIFAAHLLVVTDVEELPTHGGSLRIFAQHAQTNPTIKQSVTDVMQSERAQGLHKILTYEKFGTCIQETKRQLRAFLLDAKHGANVLPVMAHPQKRRHCSIFAVSMRGWSSLRWIAILINKVTTFPVHRSRFLILKRFRNTGPITC